MYLIYTNENVFKRLPIVTFADKQAAPVQSEIPHIFWQKLWKTHNPAWIRNGYSVFYHPPTIVRETL